MHSEFVVIGGGLSGLSTAVALHAAGREVLVVEARERLGGRILSLPRGDAPHAAFDLGPTWFWPGQTRITRLAETLGLEVFLQQDQGSALFETADGTRHLSPMGSGMSGSYRIAGGIGRLIELLARSLPAERRLLGAPLRRITRSDDGVHLNLVRHGAELSLTCARAVLTLPPRLAVQTLSFTPALDAALSAQLAAIPTWMAGHAKALAFYDRPVWRDRGLSGSAVSQRGPLMEIHDASPPSGGPFALFGFAGVPPDRRQALAAELRAAAGQQLERLFGAAPREVVLQDWAFEACTATDEDHRPLTHHPAYGLPASAEALWDGRLIFAGSETVAADGGLLEGALASSDRAVARLLAASQAPIKGR